MTLSEIRDTDSWQGAIALGPAFLQLAEELPAGEQMGLSLQIRENIVNLASGIALDLLDNESFMRRRHALRLMATLDLIDKVYPALDTASCRDALMKVVAKLDVPHPKSEAPKPAPIKIAPASVPVMPAQAAVDATLPHPAAADETNPNLKIQVTPDGEVKAAGEDDVHPDSVQ